MSLRVTQSMVQSQLLRNISSNMKRMAYNQDVLSSNSKILKPSDDPVGITYALRYRSELALNDQYKKNVDMAKSMLDHTDSVMEQINSLIQRANELTVQGTNGTNTQTSLDAIAQEMGQLYEQAVTLGNDQLNGKYIFNGQKTDQKPYSSSGAAAALNPNGQIALNGSGSVATPGESSDDQSVLYQLSDGVTLPVNVTGQDVFGGGSDTDNLFTVLKGLQTAFANGDQASAGTLLGSLQSRFNKFQDVRSEVGARSNRIDLIDSRLQALNQNLTAMDSSVEDADIGSVIIKLKSDQNVYQASLSAGAKIIQPSLIDYLH
ncbi:flagellar hook-associated protein FlgL [Paenibacillus humicola]|uniref:flagellar hook-associated protein FlgL n=1 Tax=Paenibacillus humicola TaxID=3110540 RepID=UPI00237B83B7|nr:flagellar hook-associated protein FlgL [Paenibacillus humicola]